MDLAWCTRTLALAACIAVPVVLAPRLAALDAPPRWLAMDSRCPWSAPVAGISGRLVFVDAAHGQVFFELQNRSNRSLTVPWCLYCDHALGVPPFDSDILPSGGRGQRCIVSQLVTLRSWDRRGIWQTVVWPWGPADPPVEHAAGVEIADVDLMSRCVLAPGERCLGMVAGNPLAPGSASALSMTLQQQTSVPGHWSGRLEMGPCPWFAPTTTGLAPWPAAAPVTAPTAERLPEHLAPLIPFAVPDGDLPALVREQGALNVLFNRNVPLSRAIATFRAADGAAYYMARVIAARSAIEQCYLLSQAAALQPSDEALRKLTNDLRPMSELRVADALMSLDYLAGVITFPPSTVERIAAAARSQACVVTLGGMEGRSLSTLVEESSLAYWMTVAHQPAYRRELRREVGTEHSLPAALALANYHDQSAAPLILAALRDLVAQVAQVAQVDATLNGQRQQELDSATYRLIVGARQLRIAAAVPLLLQVRQVRWQHGQIEQALTVIGDPTALPALQALRATLATGTDCGETLLPSDLAAHELELDLAIAALQPDRSAALHALLATLGAQPDAQARVLDLLTRDPAGMSPEELSEIFRTAGSHVVGAWAASALNQLPTRQATAALIRCMQSANARQLFPDQITHTQPTVGPLESDLARCLRQRTGCSLGDDFWQWRAWWQEVGCHLLGP